MLTLDTYTPACDPPDKYDEAIMYLLGVLKEGNKTEFTAAVHKAWTSCDSYVGGALFGFCAPDPLSPNHYTGYGVGPCGCLTQVRCYPGRVAATPKLTEDIKADERIPKSWETIKPDDLPVFAEWQRRMDEELNRAM